MQPQEKADGLTGPFVSLRVSLSLSLRLSFSLRQARRQIPRKKGAVECGDETAPFLLRTPCRRTLQWKMEV